MTVNIKNINVGNNAVITANRNTIKKAIQRARKTQGDKPCSYSVIPHKDKFKVYNLGYNPDDATKLKYKQLAREETNYILLLKDAVALDYIRQHYALDEYNQLCKKKYKKSINHHYIAPVYPAFVSILGKQVSVRTVRRYLLGLKS